MASSSSSSNMSTIESKRVRDKLPGGKGWFSLIILRSSVSFNLLFRPSHLSTNQRVLQLQEWSALSCRVTCLCHLVTGRTESILLKIYWILFSINKPCRSTKTRRLKIYSCFRNIYRVTENWRTSNHGRFDWFDVFFGLVTFVWENGLGWNVWHFKDYKFMKITRPDRERLMSEKAFQHEKHLIENTWICQ